MNIVKITAGAVAIALMTTGAIAQSSQSGSSSGAISGSQSASGSAAQGGNVTYAPVYNTAGRTRQDVAYSGDYTIKNTPSVGAPGIISNHICALGASGGASGSGFGISLGGQYVDPECNNRAEAAALLAVAGADVAMYHLATNDPEMCNTLRATKRIPGDSLCTDKERKANAKRRKSAAVSTKSVPAAAPNLGYKSCKLVGNQIKIRYSSGVKRDVAKKAMADKNCTLALGY